MDFVWKLYGNTYAAKNGRVRASKVGVATLNLALPAPPVLNVDVETAPLRL